MQIFAIVSGDFLMKLVWAWSYKVLKSTLVQVMAWYREATSHNLIQCWTKFMSPYGVTRPQWVKDWKVEYFIPLFSDLVPSSYLAHRWTCGHAHCCWYKMLIWPACERTDKWNGNRRLRTCQNFRISIWNWDDIWVNNRAIVMPHISIFVLCWYVQKWRVTKILNSRSPGDTTIWKNLKPWCHLNNCTTQKYNVYWWERSSAI